MSLVPTPTVLTKAYGERRFDNAAALQWNDLRDYMRDTTLSFDVLKKTLKTHLFKQVFLDVPTDCDKRMHLWYNLFKLTPLIIVNNLFAF